MRRSNPWLAVVTMLAGGVVAVGAATTGCGGKTDEPATTTDTGVVIVTDTGVDSSAPKDTGTPVVDSAEEYDVPGSIYDAVLPDVDFGDGKTTATCVDCAGKQCKSQMDACDADPRCRGLFLCVLSECAGSFTDFSCAAGCAFKFGVSGLSDPVIGKAQSVASCLQSKCPDACPAAPGDGGTGTDAKTDSASADAKTDSGPETSGYMIFPDQEKNLRSIDPRVLDLLQSVVPDSPEAKAALIARFKH